jgi:SAM-dependent methyltransferase
VTRAHLRDLYIVLRAGLRDLRARISDLIERPPSGRLPDRKATVEEMLPPSDGFSVGTGDFQAIGLSFVEEFKRSCDLAPHHHVLDVGCGTGRIAIPLTQYLSSDARYEGFDPVREAVRHCRKRISPSYPNFRFQLANLYNRNYSPWGRYKDSEYRFPYEDGAFDLVFAVSVFTHLLPEGTERYLEEAARVMKPGGNFLATFFLLNDASTEALDAGKSTIPFPGRYAVHRVEHPKIPEAAVAYDEAFVMDLYSKYGLKLTKPAGYGSWSGRAPSDYEGYQDLLVATR